MIIAVNTRFLHTRQLEGIGWFTYEILQRLVEWHRNDQFIFFFDRPYEERFIFASNVTPVVLFPPARHPFLFYWWFEIAVTKALKKYQADLFISMDGFLSLKTSIPTLLVIHDLAHVHLKGQVKYLEQKYYDYFMPLFAKKAKKIITVSEYSKQDIHRQYQIPLSSIEVVYNGANLKFRPLDNPTKNGIQQKYADGELYFFYIGAIHPRKNVHRLIQAFDLFKQKTNAAMKLLIAGRFAWHTEMVTAAYEKAVHRKDIRFLGYVQEDEVPLLMGSAFAFTYPSLFEGFGIPILEALYCNVPVITSNVSAMPEVAGEAGLLVNPTSIEEISQAMVLLYQSPEKYKQLMEAAKKQQLLYTWKQTAKKFQEVLINTIEIS